MDLNHEGTKGKTGKWRAGYRELNEVPVGGFCQTESGTLWRKIEHLESRWAEVGFEPFTRNNWDLVKLGVVFLCWEVEV